MPNESTKLKKIVSAGTLFFFLVSQVSYASPAGVMSLTGEPETPGFLQIDIPPELASIEEIYEAPPKADPQLVLHVQNAHGNYEAQVQIKKLLAYLHEKYGFNLLFVEGAAEKLNPELLKLFPTKERNLELADYLAKRGELTGVEYFLMDAPNTIEAIGIENPELYREDYKLFREVYRAKSETDQFLSGLEARLERLSSRFLSHDTRRLLSEWRKFHSGHRDFLPFVKNLAADAKKTLGLDLESLFSQIEWPQITRLLVLQSMEPELNREKAVQERGQLIEFLKSKGISKQLISDVERLEDKRINVVSLKKGESAKNDLPRYLLERLADEAGPKGFYFHDYPAFSLYAGYLILQSELESKSLFDEIERLFERILNELALREREKNLLELFRDLELSRQLLHLELSRKDWARAFYRKDWIEPQALVTRASAIEDEMKLEMLQEGASGERSQAPPSEADSKMIEVFQKAFLFYDYAQQREMAFYEKLQAEMGSRKAEKAVLVTGGFHTEGLSDIFREKGINYGILTPRLTEKAENSGYLATMMEEQPTLFDLATIEMVNRLQSIAAMKTLGVNGEKDIKSALSAVVDIIQSKVKDPTELAKILNHLLSAAYFKDRSAALNIMKSQNRNAYRVTIELPGDNDAYSFELWQDGNGNVAAVNFKKAYLNSPRATPGQTVVEETIGGVKVTLGKLDPTIDLANRATAAAQAESRQPPTAPVSTQLAGMRSRAETRVQDDGILPQDKSLRVQGLERRRLDLYAAPERGIIGAINQWLNPRKNRRVSDTNGLGDFLHSIIPRIPDAIDVQIIRLEWQLNGFFRHTREITLPREFDGPGKSRAEARAGRAEVRGKSEKQSLLSIFMGLLNRDPRVRGVAWKAILLMEIQAGIFLISTRSLEVAAWVGAFVGALGLFVGLSPMLQTAFQQYRAANVEPKSMLLGFLDLGKRSEGLGPGSSSRSLPPPRSAILENIILHSIELIEWVYPEPSPRITRILDKLHQVGENFRDTREQSSPVSDKRAVVGGRAIPRSEMRSAGNTQNPVLAAWWISINKVVAALADLLASKKVLEAKKRETAVAVEKIKVDNQGTLISSQTLEILGRQKVKGGYRKISILIDDAGTIRNVLNTEPDPATLEEGMSKGVRFMIKVQRNIEGTDDDRYLYSAPTFNTDVPEPLKAILQESIERANQQLKAQRDEAIKQNKDQFLSEEFKDALHQSAEYVPPLQNEKSKLKIVRGFINPYTHQIEGFLGIDSETAGVRTDIEEKVRRKWLELLLELSLDRDQEAIREKLSKESLGYSADKIGQIMDGVFGQDEIDQLQQALGKKLDSFLTYVEVNEANKAEIITDLSPVAELLNKVSRPTRGILFESIQSARETVKERRKSSELINRGIVLIMKSAEENTGEADVKLGQFLRWIDAKLKAKDPLGAEAFQAVRTGIPSAVQSQLLVKLLESVERKIKRAARPNVQKEQAENEIKNAKGLIKDISLLAPTAQFFSIERILFLSDQLGLQLNNEQKQVLQAKREAPISPRGEDLDEVRNPDEQIQFAAQIVRNLYPQNEYLEAEAHAAGDFIKQHLVELPGGKKNMMLLAGATGMTPSDLPSILRVMFDHGIGAEFFLQVYQRALEQGVQEIPEAREALLQAQKFEAEKHLLRAWALYSRALFLGYREAEEDTQRVKSKWLASLQAAGFKGRKNKDGTVTYGDLRASEGLEQFLNYFIPIKNRFPIEVRTRFLGFAHAIVFHGDLYANVSFDQEGNLLGIATKLKPLLSQRVEDVKISLSPGGDKMILSGTWKGYEVERAEVFMSAEGEVQYEMGGFDAVNENLAKIPPDPETLRVAHEAAGQLLEKGFDAEPVAEIMGFYSDPLSVWSTPSKALSPRGFQTLQELRTFFLSKKEELYSDRYTSRLSRVVWEEMRKTKPGRSLEELVRSLSDADPDQRRMALTALTYNYGKEAFPAVPAVIKLLHEGGYSTTIMDFFEVDAALAQPAMNDLILLLRTKEAYLVVPVLERYLPEKTLVEHILESLPHASNKEHQGYLLRILKKHPSQAQIILPTAKKFRNSIRDKRSQPFKDASDLIETLEGQSPATKTAGKRSEVRGATTEAAPSGTGFFRKRAQTPEALAEISRLAGDLHLPINGTIEENFLSLNGAQQALTNMLGEYLAPTERVEKLFVAIVKAFQDIRRRGGGTDHHREKVIARYHDEQHSAEVALGGIRFLISPSASKPGTSVVSNPRILELAALAAILHDAGTIDLLGIEQLSFVNSQGETQHVNIQRYPFHEVLGIGGEISDELLKGMLVNAGAPKDIVEGPSGKALVESARTWIQNYPFSAQKLFDKAGVKVAPRELEIIQILIEFTKFGDVKRADGTTLEEGKNASSEEQTKRLRDRLIKAGIEEEGEIRDILNAGAAIAAADLITAVESYSTKPLDENRDAKNYFQMIADLYEEGALGFYDKKPVPIFEAFKGTAYFLTNVVNPRLSGYAARLGFTEANGYSLPEFEKRFSPTQNGEIFIQFAMKVGQIYDEALKAGLSDENKEILKRIFKAFGFSNIRIDQYINQLAAASFSNRSEMRRDDRSASRAAVLGLKAEVGRAPELKLDGLTTFFSDKRFVRDFIAKTISQQSWASLHAGKSNKVMLTIQASQASEKSETLSFDASRTPQNISDSIQAALEKVEADQNYSPVFWMLLPAGDGWRLVATLEKPDHVLSTIASMIFWQFQLQPEQGAEELVITGYLDGRLNPEAAEKELMHSKGRMDGPEVRTRDQVREILSAADALKAKYLEPTKALSGDVGSAAAVSQSQAPRESFQWSSYLGLDLLKPGKDPAKYQAHISGLSAKLALIGEYTWLYSREPSIQGAVAQELNGIRTQLQAVVREWLNEGELVAQTLNREELQLGTPPYQVENALRQILTPLNTPVNRREYKDFIALAEHEGITVEKIYSAQDYFVREMHYEFREPDPDFLKNFMENHGSFKSLDNLVRAAGENRAAVQTLMRLIARAFLLDLKMLEDSEQYESPVRFKPEFPHLGQFVFITESYSANFSLKDALDDIAVFVAERNNVRARLNQYAHVMGLKEKEQLKSLGARDLESRVEWLLKARNRPMLAAQVAFPARRLTLDDLLTADRTLLEWEPGVDQAQPDFEAYKETLRAMPNAQTISLQDLVKRANEEQSKYLTAMIIRTALLKFRLIEKPAPGQPIQLTRDIEQKSLSTVDLSSYFLFERDVRSKINEIMMKQFYSLSTAHRRKVEAKLKLWGKGIPYSPFLGDYWVVKFKDWGWRELNTDLLDASAVDGDDLEKSALRWAKREIESVTLLTGEPAFEGAMGDGLTVAEVIAAAKRHRDDILQNEKDVSSTAALARPASATKTAGKRAEVRGNLVDSLEESVKALEARVTAQGTQNIPTLGFHGQKPGTSGQYHYFVFEGKNHITSFLGRTIMPLPEFQERLQGIMIYIANYSSPDWSKGIFPKIHILTETPDFIISGVPDEKSKTGTLPLEVLGTQGTQRKHFRYFYQTGAASFNTVPAEAIHEITISRAEYQDIEAKAKALAQPSIGKTENLLITSFANRFLYKKALETILGLSRSETRAYYDINHLGAVINEKVRGIAAQWQKARKNIPDVYRVSVNVEGVRDSEGEPIQGLETIVFEGKVIKRSLQSNLGGDIVAAMKAAGVKEGAKFDLERVDTSGSMIKGRSRGMQFIVKQKPATEAVAPTAAPRDYRQAVAFDEAVIAVQVGILDKLQKDAFPPFLTKGGIIVRGGIKVTVSYGGPSGKKELFNITTRSGSSVPTGYGQQVFDAAKEVVEAGGTFANVVIVTERAFDNAGRPLLPQAVNPPRSEARLPSDRLGSETVLGRQAGDEAREKQGQGAGVKGQGVEVVEPAVQVRREKKNEPGARITIPVQFPEKEEGWSITLGRQNLKREAMFSRAEERVAAAVTGLIFGPSANAEEARAELRLVAKTISESDTPKALRDAQGLMQKFKLSSINAGATILAVTELPTEAELKGIELQLAANPNLLFYILVATASDQVASTKKQALALVSEMKSRFTDQYGMDISKRFAIEAVNNDKLALGRAMQLMSGRLYRSMKSVAAVLNANIRADQFLVLIARDKMATAFDAIADTIQGHIIPLVNAAEDSVRIAANMVAGRYAQSMSAQEVDEETRQALEFNDQGVPTGFNLSTLKALAAQLWTEFQGLLKAKAAA